MEGEGDHSLVRAEDGVCELGHNNHSLPSSAEKSQAETDTGVRLGSQVHNDVSTEASVVDDSVKHEVSLPKSESNTEWEGGQDSRVTQGVTGKVGHSSMTISPCSNDNSEGSEREILLEPLSADDESTPVSESRAFSAEAPENETVPNEEPPSLSGAAFGPSEDREDISDEELELYSQENSNSVQLESWASEDVQESYSGATYNPDSGSHIPETATEGSRAPVTAETVPFNDNDARDSHSSDDREIIDLKYEDAAGKSDEDAAGKSDTGSHDGVNQQSNVPSEDLETVSDDELPDGTLGGEGPVKPAFHLIEGGEDVSSSEDEETVISQGGMHVDHSQELTLGSTPHSNNLALDGCDFSYGNMSSSDLAFKTDEISGVQLISDPPPSIALPLAPLEAEPISDEEDLGHGDNGFVEVDGGEAGEIKSPADAGSPIMLTEQTAARLLGEVEPISADESSDTDGELPSGDEDSLSKTEKEGPNTNNFLESIDSEDEGDLAADLSHKHLPSHRRHLAGVSSESFLKQKSGEYMETISDDDDGISTGGHDIKQSASSVRAEESHTSTRSTESEKRQIATNYTEHQEELDYEENEADDGEGKSAETLRPAEKRDVKEAPQEGQGGSSDKDEGELSDDDCEEGEIKEPGSKKPFIKQTCRFFQRGNCTWGINCRFIHPGINDKGNYQMIEIPGFKPVGVRSRLGLPGPWPEQPEEQIELPPPPVPDVPPVETAWERGLRIAKEQRKKASERKELEADFEDKRLNLSVDEERELNKENERMPKTIPQDPYCDQYGLEDDYYHTPRDPWQTGRYENFEVRYNTDHTYSPPYREKPPVMSPPPPLPLPPPQPRFAHPYSPHTDKFGRDRIDRREPFRPEPPPVSHEYPPPNKRPDEWTDPWRRSKSPKNQKRKVRSRSRGRRARRSVSDSSNSSRSSSGSSSGSSRSSRSFNSSTGSSSRSRSPEPVPAGGEKHDRYISPSREQPRSMVSIRGSGSHNHYDQGYRRGGRMYDHGRDSNMYNQRGGNRGGGAGGGSYNNYGGMGGYPPRDIRDRERFRDDRMGRKRAHSPPDRPLPYVRPRPKSVSSHSSSSRSRSRSRGRATSSRSRSRSRSSSASSRSSSSSSSSAGSADSEHLYRDLGSPSNNPRVSAQKRKRNDSLKERPVGTSQQIPLPPGPPRRQPPPPQPPINLDHIPPPRDPKPPLPPLPPGRPESKYASRNAPPPPVKAKDPLKVVGQKSNIKLTLLPKQQQQLALGARPNPLDSPPHKRRLSERDSSPPPAAKRANLPVPSQSTALRLAIEKASKIQIRQEKVQSPQPAVAPQSLPSSSSLSASIPRGRAALSPQKQASNAKPRLVEPSVAKTVPKVPAANAPTAAATGTKAKKSMSSRREELLKQLKAVEDAIARKKSKLQ